MAKFYRLSPLESPTRPTATIFDLRDAIGTELVLGNNWGQDYLRAPDSEEDQSAAELLFKESGMFYEVVQGNDPKVSLRYLSMLRSLSV